MKFFIKRVSSQNNIKDTIINYSKMDKGTLLKHFKTSEKGYTTKKAEEIREEFGINEIKNKNDDANLKLLLKAFLNPFVILLFFIILISIFTDIVFSKQNEYSAIIILTIIILISVFLHYIQDLKSKKSVTELKAMVSNTTAIMRNSMVRELPLEEVVPGDIIKLSAGDIIPADVRIIDSKDLFLSQSTFTGESIPIEKFSTILEDTNDIFDLNNICFMGTNVQSGSATAIVIATGKNTYLGHMSKTMLKPKEATAFDRGINKVSWLLIKITLVMVPLVFLINAITKGDIFLAFVFAITVAVGITPELLPMIVTSNLAIGSVNMSKRKTIIKDLNSIQNLGAIDILCTDKTGTITEDKIVLNQYLDIHGKEDIRILKHAYLNSYFQTGLNNLLDEEIIKKAHHHLVDGIKKYYKKVDEIPFDFERRRMSIVLENKEGTTELITKGAPSETIAICKYAEYDGKIIEIDDILRTKVKALTKNLSAEGLRIIALARKNDNISVIGSFSVKDESDMILMGFVSFLDPPKVSAKPVIKLLQQYGVKVKVITGDNELVAKKVCSEVGIDITNTLTNKDIENMDDEELLERVEKTTLFSKISPLEKARIVRLLQNKGHTVGYLGDGINDAPALIQADVGISVDTGVEIAKESADVILLEKNLLVLQHGITEGRKVFANIMKYINMATSSNIGNMISVLFASIFIPFLPMLPIHILVQNLLYDLSQTSIPFDNVDDDYLKKPRKWETKNMFRFIAWFGPTSSIFDFLTFAVLWYIIGATAIQDQALFHSGWFIMGLISQTLVIHIIRTDKFSLIKSKASSIVIIATLLISIIGLLIPYTPIGSALQLVPPPVTFLFWLIILLAGYFFTTHLIKIIYIKRYKEWL